MPWRPPPRRPLRPAWLSLLCLLLSGGPSPAAAGAQPLALPDAAALPWRLTKEGSFTATQFRLAQLYGGPTPEFLAFGREALGEGLSSVLVHDLDAPQNPSWQWNFPTYQGGLAGGGDLEGDGTEELIFWRYDPERKRLGFRLERLRRNDAGVLASETLLVCAEIAAGHEGTGHEHLPRSHPEGRILAAEGRILVPVMAGFNWRSAARGLLVYDLQGALRTQIRLPNNTFGYRFADLDGDARRELFLSCYASGNGDSCARGDDGHSYWRVLDLEGRDRLNVPAGGFATMATTQPLRPSAQALPLVLASLGRSQADELRLYDGEGVLVRARSLPGATAGPPLVTDLDRDGAEDILVGLADGSLLQLDARLEERSRWRFPAVAQPLSAADLTGDARPELVLRIGDELLVCAADLTPLARWTGWLNDRLVNPLVQVGSWQGEDGLRRLALVGLLPNQVGILRLERNPAVDDRDTRLAVVVGLLVLAGGAIAWLTRERRRLTRQLLARSWLDGAGNWAPDAAAEDALWRELARALRSCDNHGHLRIWLTSLADEAEHLKGQDSIGHRQGVAAAAAETQKLLPGLLAVEQLACRLLGETSEVKRMFELTRTLADALGTLAAGADARAFILDSGVDLGQTCRELKALSTALAQHVEVQAQETVLLQLQQLLPALLEMATALGVPLELALAGPLDRHRPKLLPDEFSTLLKSFVEISLTRVPGGSHIPLRLTLAIAADSLQLSAETPGGRDGQTTAARWEAFAGQKRDGVQARREGDALRLRIALRPHAPGAVRARGAVAGLGALLALLVGVPAACGVAAAEAIRYQFHAQEAITFDPTAAVQLHCGDIDGDGADNVILLLRAERAAATWLLVQRQQGHARVDSIPLAAAGDWRLLGAGDMDADGRAEILLSRWQPDTLELRRLWFPSSAAATREERLLALPLAARPAAGVPVPHFTQMCKLAAGGGYAFAYSLSGPGSPSGLIACSATRELLWQRVFTGPLRLEDCADPDGDGRRELLVAVAAAGPNPLATAPGRADSSWCLDLDAQGMVVRSQACGGPGSEPRRKLLRQRDGPVLGELRLLQPRESSAQGTRVEYRPAASSPLVLEPTWRCQDAAVLDLDGDGREEIVLATFGAAGGQGQLIAFDRELQEVGRCRLPGRPRALHVADFAGDGPSQLLVVLPDDLLLLDRKLALQASLRGKPNGARDIRELLPCRRGSAKPADLALLGAGQLLLLRAEVDWDGGDPAVLLGLACLALGGLLGLILGVRLARWRDAGRRQAWLRAGPWQPRARLLGLLLDLRCRARGPEHLAALREACLLAAGGDAEAARRVREAQAELQPELERLLAAWLGPVDPAGQRRLRSLLAAGTGDCRPDGWRRLARDLDRLSSGLSRLQLQLARQLSADPVAGFQGALARCLRDEAALAEFSLSVPGGRVPLVFFEPTQLGIVFENLVENALHCLSPGRPRRLHLEIEPQGDQLRLLLEDSGLGVPAGMEERIFELGVSTRGPGHGKGLAIVRDLIGHFGGRIVCLPGPGSLGGARFELRLRLLG